MKFRKTLCAILAFVLAIGVFGGTAAYAAPTPDFDMEPVVNTLKGALNYIRSWGGLSTVSTYDYLYGYKRAGNGDVFKITVDKDGNVKTANVGAEMPSYSYDMKMYDFDMVTVRYAFDIDSDGVIVVKLGEDTGNTGNTGGTGNQVTIIGEPTIKPEETGYTTSSWAEADVSTAKELGIFEKAPRHDIGRVSDFSENATRGDLCGYIAGLFKALGKQEILDNAFSWSKDVLPTTDADGVITWQGPFNDVDIHSPVFEYGYEVYQLYYLGIINGVGDGKFDYDGTLTRETAATILIRAADVLGIDAPDVNIPFKDNISAWALNGVRRAYGAKLMGGYSDTDFGAKDPYTIEQAIVTTYRLYQLGNK